MIVLVDDDVSTLRLLGAVVGSAGYRSVAFSDPIPALEHLASTPGVELVLSDVRMPTMTGLEFVRALRQVPGARHTPVVMCTSAADLATVRAALDLGIRDYIIKPVDPAVVLQKLARVLVDPSTVLEPRSRVVTRLGISDSDYFEFAHQAVLDLERLVAQLEAAAPASDAEAIVAAAERIGTSARLLGAHRVTDLVDAILARPASADDRVGFLISETVALRSLLIRDIRLATHPRRSAAGVRRELRPSDGLQPVASRARSS